MANPVPADLLPESLRQPKAVPTDLLPDEFRGTAVPTNLLPPSLSASEPTPESQSSWRQVADVPLQFQKGYVSGIRLLSDALGADSSISKSLRGVEEHLAGLMSAQSKKDSAEMARIMKDAEDKGIADQVWAGVKALSVAPVDTVVNALGTTAPAIAASLVGGLPAAAAVGTAMGAGTVKGAVYETVNEQLQKSGMSAKEAEARATKAQEYFGENTGSIALGAGLGALEAATGMQPALAKILGRGVATRTVEEIADEIAKKTMSGAVLKGAFKEAAPEFLQGSQEQLARNLALQKEGYDVPTMRGVLTQGTLEAGAGAMMGGVTGPVELAAERQQVQTLQNKIEDLQNTPPPPGSDEERVLKLAAELEARGNMDRQSAMILAMKTVADENIQSEKIDGAKPPEQLGNAPLFIFDTAEQAQERTNQLKRNRPKENFAFQETPDGKFAIYKVPPVAGGTPNVAEPTPQAGGISPAMPSAGAAGVSTPGAGAPVAGGVVPAGAVAAQPNVGEAAQPGALDETGRTKKRYDELVFATPEEAQAVLAGLPNKNLKQVVETDEGFVIKDRPASEIPVPPIPEGYSYQDRGDGMVMLLPNKPQPELTAPAAATTTEEPSVSETPEAVETEAQRQEEPPASAAPVAEEVLSEVETEAKAAVDEAKAATDEVQAVEDQRAAEAETRTKGQGEPAEFRRMSRDASEKLANAIDGKSGLISVIQKLQVQLERARAALEPYGGEQFNEDLMRRRGETTEEEFSQDMADMEEAYSYFNRVRNRYDDALKSLAEFNVNPRFEQNPQQAPRINEAQARTLEFIKTLPYDDKLKAFQSVLKKEAAMEAAPEPAAAPKQEGPAPTVTVKKRRKVEIPPAAKQRKLRRALATSLRTDEAFENFSGQPITEALKHIAATGNAFERALATRLLARDNRLALKDTPLYVLDAEDVAQMEGTEADMTGANGLYYLGDNGDAIFLRGTDFGTDYDANGVNNQTVLHEALHATVNKRLIYALYGEELGLRVPEELARTARELEELMYRAQDALDQYMADNPDISDKLQYLMDGGAFDNITEFVTYGMTDAAMQSFLRENVGGVVTKSNGLNDFVRLILDMLGLGPEHVSGLRDLIEYTNKLAASVDIGAETARAVIDMRDKNAAADIQAVSQMAKKEAKKATNAKEKVETSASADQLVEDLGSLSTVAKNPKLWGEYLSMNLSNISFDGLNTLLAVMPTHMVVEMGANKGLTHLDEVDVDVREMATMRTKMQTRVQDIATPWIKLSAATQKQLGKVMSMATLEQIDPADPKQKGRNAELDRMYRELPKEAKDVYVAARDFYADNYALYRALLERAAERMGGDPDTLTAIKTLYEVAKNKGPYFPLMRYGEFWARFGKGDNKEFYMFESAGLRDVFIERRMKELAAKGEKRTFDEMMETDDVDRGNDAEALRKQMVKDNLKLQNLFNTIDKASGLGDEKVRAALKDQVYQMMLLALPEASLRKHFIHRKGVTGFSGDALRNFLNSGTRMANQMARVRYGADITNALDMSREALKGNPEKDKLEAIVKEVERRAQDELNPPIDDTFMEKVARKANKIAFIWLLTGAKSAFNQMFSVVNFSLPTLAARHGWVPAMTEMGKYLALGYGQIGISKKMPDGSTKWVPPTIGLSNRVANNPEEQRAYQRMQDMGISDMTRTYDLFMRRGAPSANFNSRWAAVTNVMGALFHHSERISREITFMTSFRLAKNAGMTFEQAIDTATRDVNTALFDYSAWNRPRALRSAPVRVVSQFKQFPMYVTLYLARNGYQMIKSGATVQERKEAASMLFGTLGLTALFGGSSAMFGYSAIMGIIQGIRNALRDDDEEDPLGEMDTEMWFRNVFLPETFGETTFMGMNLAELIDSGVLNTATGYDLASGVSLNNMWFHDTPDANNWKGAFDGTVTSMMGPGAAVVRNMFAGIDDFNSGQYMRGAEKILPAFFRGGATSARFYTEGALSKTGAEIKAAEDFTFGQLVAQTLGFKTTGLAQVMNNNYLIQQKIDGLKNERSNLMKKLDIALQGGSDSDVDDVLDEIDAFGSRYPTYRVKNSEIASSIKAREKLRRKSDAGLYLDKRAREFDVLRDRALKNLEAETEK